MDITHGGSYPVHSVPHIVAAGYRWDNKSPMFDHSRIDFVLMSVLSRSSCNLQNHRRGDPQRGAGHTNWEMIFVQDSLGPPLPTMARRSRREVIRKVVHKTRGYKHIAW